MIKSILIHEYQDKSTRVNTSPTRVNTNQYESIRVRHDFTRINTIVNCKRSQHESYTSQHESTRVQNRSRSDSSQNLRTIKPGSITF